MDVDVPLNTGKVVTVNGRKLAVYNDNGKLLTFSTTCPHAACDVDWHRTENQWFCPCHGSRFAPDGSLVKGPAARGLYPKEL